MRSSLAHILLTAPAQPALRLTSRIAACATQFKRLITRDSGAFNFTFKQCKVRCGFSRMVLQHFLAQFITPRAKRVAMLVYLFNFCPMQFFAAWSVYEATSLYARDDLTLRLTVSIGSVDGRPRPVR